MKKICIFSLLLLLTGCASKSVFTDANLDVPIIKVTSTSIEDGQLSTITVADRTPNNPLGDNQSPAVSWDAVEDANYYAVCMFDEDANWLHFFVMDIQTTSIEQGKYSSPNVYVGPYPPKNGLPHHYRIEVFAIKEQPNDFIGKLDGKNSYENIVNHLNQVGGKSDNIIARGHVTATYKNCD